jgi:hypothetical protein
MLQNAYVDYTEDVSNVFAASDKSNLVVIGARYHYIFKAPAGLLDALASGVHPSMDAKFSDFYVDSQNHVSGSLKLIIRSVAPEASELASQFEFRKVGYSFEKVMPLDGVRFVSPSSFASESTTLNRSYSVRVREPEGIAKRGLKIAATPVTLAADGGLLLLGLPLVPFFCSGKDACK